jgi:Sulfotransferase family
MSVTPPGAPLCSHEAGGERPHAAGSPAFQGEGVILIFGLPRSGTSWLGKIFDSHPDVLYRHEPDLVVRDERLPNILLDEERDPYRDLAREFLQRLILSRTLKAAGPPPYLPKNYRPSLARLLRTGILFGLGAVEHVLGGATWPQRISIPDFVGRARQPLQVVVKSVSIGRARLFAEAWPQSRVVVILRHPCGQIGSEARGVALGKFARRGANVALARSAKAEMMGLRVDALDRLTPIEQLAWRWAFWNQVMLDDFAGASRAKIIRYDDLASEPERATRDLFAFAGLSWHPQTARFLEASTSHDGSSRYFGVVREAAAAANRWREELSAEDKERILGIACRAAVGGLFAP